MLLPLLITLPPGGAMWIESRMGRRIWPNGLQMERKDLIRHLKMNKRKAISFFSYSNKLAYIKETVSIRIWQWTRTRALSGWFNKYAALFNSPHPPLMSLCSLYQARLSRDILKLSWVLQAFWRSFKVFFLHWLHSFLFIFSLFLPDPTLFWGMFWTLTCESFKHNERNLASNQFLIVSLTTVTLAACHKDR